MSEPTETVKPTVVLKWRVESWHKREFRLDRDRDQFIDWFELDDDATDAQIVAALEGSRMPPMMEDGLAEISDEHTETGVLVDEDFNFETRGIEATP